MSTTRPLTHARPTAGESFVEAAPLIAAPPLYGPPIFFVLGPWLFVVLLLIPPAAMLLTLALVVAVAAGLLMAVSALVASPYLLVRHMLARHAARQRPAPSPVRAARPAPRLGEPVPRLGSPLR
jgi:hypothetical protein